MSVFGLIGIAVAVVFVVQLAYNLWHFLYTTVVGAALKKTIDVTKYGPWAVVTGATDGIGKAFAFKLASKGLNVVLVSRNPQKLKTVAQEIEQRYPSVKTRIIAVDFTDGGDTVYEKLRKELSTVQVGLLVNNVGMISDKLDFFFHQRDNDKYCRDIINCNIMSVTRVTNAVLPAMVNRQKGLIINISSLCAPTPTPLLTVYGATKAFVDKFSRDLALELEPRGIVVQTVLPGYVSTNMTRHVERSLMNPLPETFVEAQMKTLGLEKRTSAYWNHKIQLYFGEWLNFFIRDKLGQMFIQFLAKTRKDIDDTLLN